MSKYTMDNGAVVDTDNATASWPEATRWNGNNHVSRATGSQWEHETLYKSAKGRYWIESTSQWQGSLPRAFFVSNEDAARWLLGNEHELPGDLREYEGAIVE